jgi:glycosyltransferase involved in cell wall biosynthesis
MTSTPLRILLIVDPLISVPPLHYGGIERVVADLAAELHRRGHQITVWAGPGSQSPGQLQTFGRSGEIGPWCGFRNTALITARLWRYRKQFDIIHNFGRLAYLTGALRWNTPKVQTYMRRIAPRNIRRVDQLGGRRIRFTAVSAATRDTGAPGGGTWTVIYNCASVGTYQLRAEVDPATAPLLFLGRLERCKGAHTAIDVARRLNRRLIVAGNISNLPEENEYFRRELEPNFDGRLISYIGTVNDQQKNELLGGAAALLLPIEWEEPFPVVLPEALLCGTPVIAFRRGGVPEGITHGVTGFLCDTPEEMAALVGRLGEIDRQGCRAEGERRFSNDSIVSDYETLYRELLAR